MDFSTLDTELLIWINQSWGHPWLDTLFSWLSAKLSFSFPLIAIVCLYFGLRFGHDGWKFSAIFILFIVFSDGFGNLLKHLFDQARPCLELANQLRGLGGASFGACEESSTGMPSNHALNFFAAFTFLSLLIPKKAWIVFLFTIAFSVGVSRIYLAAHFPSQVIAGILFGAMIGSTAGSLMIRRWEFLKNIQSRLKISGAVY
ncbi:MAG: phosphatase PAP2 family protein [Gammaproteobacteria bacterium]|nr:phosphatase PAP2 family protein [Gammaproteobacteria bacterium]